jgi:hypothetical protein
MKISYPIPWYWWVHKHPALSSKRQINRSSHNFNNKTGKAHKHSQTECGLNQWKQDVTSQTSQWWLGTWAGQPGDDNKQWGFHLPECTFKSVITKKAVDKYRINSGEIWDCMSRTNISSWHASMTTRQLPGWSGIRKSGSRNRSENPRFTPGIYEQENWQGTGVSDSNVPKQVQTFFLVATFLDVFPMVFPWW